MVRGGLSNAMSRVMRETFMAGAHLVQSPGGRGLGMLEGQREARREGLE